MGICDMKKAPKRLVWWSGAAISSRRGTACTCGRCHGAGVIAAHLWAGRAPRFPTLWRSAMPISARSTTSNTSCSMPSSKVAGGVPGPAPWSFRAGFRLVRQVAPDGVEQVGHAGQARFFQLREVGQSPTQSRRPSSPDLPWRPCLPLAYHLPRSWNDRVKPALLQNAAQDLVLRRSIRLISLLCCSSVQPGMPAQACLRCRRSGADIARV